MLICVRCGWLQRELAGEHILVVHECSLCPNHTEEYKQALDSIEQYEPVDLPMPEEF